MSEGYAGNVKLTGKKEVFEYTLDQLEELDKCANDFFYFVERCKIVHPDKGKIDFIPYEAQKRFMQSVLDNTRVLSLQPRQSGKTTSVAAVLLWYALFKEDFSILILAQKAKGARNVLSRIKIMYEHLPKWMKVPVVEWNKGSIEFANGSWIAADATGPDAGRGESISFLYLDEFAIVQRTIQKEFMESVFPTISSGENTKIAITTTPKGFDMFYRFWQDSKAGKNSYDRVPIYWWEVPGRDEKWKKEMIEGLGSERAFNQEFGIEFLGNSNTLIDTDALESIYPEDPLWEKNNGLRVYYEPEEHHQYVLCVDVGEGVGGDYSAISVIDITQKPFRQVAVLQNNTVIPPVFPEVIYSVARMYNNGLVLIELNGPGAEVAHDLTDDLEYENVLWTSNNGGRKGQVLTAGIGGKRLQPGVKTTMPTKKKGVINLKGIIENEQLIIKDEETVDELMNFVQKKNSYEADDGHHDDIVMTLVLFGWMSTQDFFSQLSRENVRAMMAKRHKDEYEEMTPNPISFLYDNPALDIDEQKEARAFLKDDSEELLGSKRVARDKLWW